MVALTSAATLTPTYCEWLCPFKAVTEFEAVTSATVLVQAVIFVSLFVGLVVVLPILTKRRTQCGLFCPMGAFQSLTNKLNIFDVRIDPDKCVQCGRCEKVCPTFSIDRESRSRKAGPASPAPSAAGASTNVPKGAISYHVKGTPVGVRPQAARLLFVYPGVPAPGHHGQRHDHPGRLYRVLLLATTGSMIQ